MKIKNDDMRKKKSKNNVESEEQQTTTSVNQEQNETAGVNECCKEQIELMGDKYLRLLAEFDNFKKRTLKEKEELYKTASSKVITAILPILDDMDRALLTIPETQDNMAVIEGFNLINKKFKGILQQMGLEPLQSLHTEFNTDFHEALTTVEVEEEKKGKVIDEIEKGYMLNGHLIRFAKVVVGK
jgi:molecular chaperone GrpE